MSKLPSFNSYSDAAQFNKKIDPQGVAKSPISFVNTKALKPLDLLEFEKQQARFEKAVHQGNAIDLPLDKTGLDPHELTSQALNYSNQIEKNDMNKHAEIKHGLPLSDSLRELISNLSRKEDVLGEVNVKDGSHYQLMVNPADFSNGLSRVSGVYQSNLISKVDLVQSMVAEIVPKVFGVSDKNTVTIRLSSEGTAGLEIQISRQGNELSMIVKTANTDVFNQVVNARQDIQYSLESKLPNIMVRIDMDLTDQPDRESKGYYVLPDEDES